MRSVLDTLPASERSDWLEIESSVYALTGWHKVQPRDSIDLWKETVEESCGEYHLGLDDYTNDLIRREFIQDCLDSATEQQLPALRKIIAHLDQQFRDCTLAIDRPLYGGRDTPERLWFYYRIPQRWGEELAEDIERQDLSGSIRGRQP